MEAWNDAIETHIRGKPAANLVIKKAIPPSRFQLCEHLDKSAFLERQGAGVIRLKVVKGAYEERGWVVRLVCGAGRLIV